MRKLLIILIVFCSCKATCPCQQMLTSGCENVMMCPAINDRAIIAIGYNAQSSRITTGIIIGDIKVGADTPKITNNIFIGQ